MEQRFITFETVAEPIDPDKEQSAVKPVFAQIFAALEKGDLQVLEAPTEWDSYGWYADFQVGDARVTCMMQRSDTWLILIEAHRSLMDRLKGRKYQEELDRFAKDALAAIKASTGVSAKLYNSEVEFRAS